MANLTPRQVIRPGRRGVRLAVMALQSKWEKVTAPPKADFLISINGSVGRSDGERTNSQSLGACHIAVTAMNLRVLSGIVDYDRFS